MSLSSQPSPSQLPEPAPTSPPVTTRALLLGTLCVIFMAWGGHWTRHIGHTTKMAQDHLPWGVVVPFFIIAAFLNKIIHKVRPSAVFTSTELLVIFGMAGIGSALPSYFMAHLISNIAATHYYPTPENGWAIDLLPNLAKWTVVTDRQAVRWFFEGLPRGASIPWNAWAVPLFWRMSLVGAVASFCYCTVAILRKQWVEHERLTFPLMALPLHATRPKQPDEEGFWTIGFMNSPLFWLGAAIGSFAILWNIIGYFVPLFPEIPRGAGQIQFGTHFPPVLTRIYPVIIGSAYFIDLDVSLTIWVFRLLITLEMGFLNRIGVDIGPTHGAGNTLFENWNDLGALLLIIPWSLWMAREHLATVFRKAWHGDPDIDDSRELIPYRGALLGWVGSALFIIGWCIASGMALLTAIVFFAFVVIIWLGVTRMSIEGGLISTRPIHAQTATFHILGAVNMRPSGMVAIAMTRTWHRDMKTALIAPTANAVRLFDALREHRLRLGLAVAIAVVVVAGGSAWYAIDTGYQTGAYNYGSIYADSVQSTFDEVVAYIRDPFAVKRFRAWWTLLGFGTVSAMALLRYLFPWWPLHPIGFVTATTYPAKIVPFSIFISWLAKLIILRAGGISLYRRATPFFLGLMLGYFGGVAISFVIDVIWFPGEGHSLGLY